MEQIHNLLDLKEAVDNRQSIVCPGGGGIEPRPAAWAMNWSGGRLLFLFRSGMFIYEKPKKEDKDVS